MKITVRFHAFLRETAGVAAFDMALPHGATMLDAVRAAAKLHPPVASLLLLRAGGIAPYVKLQLNGRPLPEPAATQLVHEGDELALFPTLSGG